MLTYREIKKVASDFADLLKAGISFNLDTVRKIDRFYPSSANWHLYPDVTLRGVNNFPIQLIELMRSLEFVSNSETTTAEEFNQEKELAARLGIEFERQGSDKSTTHNYHLVYGEILSAFDSNVSILEIGIGSTAKTQLSTMGVSGTPGASLRAFRNCLNGSKIYGADVDPGVLFSEEGIDCFLLDQLDGTSFVELEKQIGIAKFDLVIDDGLHAPEANLNTLIFLIDRLTPGGWLVIEDIPARSLPVWEVVAQLLSVKMIKSRLIACSSAYMFLIQPESN